MIEHAAEFQLFNQRLQLGSFCLYGFQPGLVAFFLAHLKQLSVVSQFGCELLQCQNDGVERFFFFAQFLGFFGVVPDRRVF